MVFKLTALWLIVSQNVSITNLLPIVGFYAKSLVIRMGSKQIRLDLAEEKRSMCSISKK